MTAHVNTTITKDTTSDNATNGPLTSIKKISKQTTQDSGLGFVIETSKLDDDEPSPAPYSGMSSQTQQPQAKDLYMKKKHRSTGSN